MKYFKPFIFLVFIVVFFNNCVPDENDVGVVNDNPNIKKSEKFFSPDRRCYVTIYESVFDSSESNTQVVISFGKTGQVFTV